MRNWISLVESSQNIFYHGSTVPITKFNLDYLSSGKGYDEEGPGIYFTSSEHDAKIYGKYVIKVKINLIKSRILPEIKTITSDFIRNAIINSPSHENDLSNWDENINRALELAVKSIKKYGNEFREACEQLWYDFYRNNSKEYLTYLISNGYDGFILNKADGVKHAIIFNPSIINIIDIVKL